MHSSCSKLSLTLKTAISRVSMKVPLLSLVATETEELGSCLGNKIAFYYYLFFDLVLVLFLLKISRYSRYYLCVVDQVFQGVAAGEVIIEVCGVADQPLVRSRCVYVACDDN